MNIDEISNLNGKSLSEAVTAFLVPLQTTRTLNQDAFSLLLAESKQLAKLLKEHKLIPKIFLNEIYGSIQTIRNEAPHFKNERATLEGMADQLEYVFALIMIGESDEDRNPGVCRII